MGAILLKIIIMCFIVLLLSGIGLVISAIAWISSWIINKILK